VFSLFDLWPEGPLDTRRAFVIEEPLPGCYCTVDHGPWSFGMAPNRMTAYQNARAAAGPQKGLTYSELLLDNLLGLDNDYLSAGEQLGQAFNADELGFLKNAGLSAYEGAKGAVTSPIETIQGVGDAIYGSGEDLYRGVEGKLQELFGVGYREASPEQVTQARESLVGDVLNVSQLIPGAAMTKKGLGSLAVSVADEVVPENDFYKLLTGQMDAPPPSTLPPPPQAVTLSEQLFSRAPVPESSNPIGPRAGVGPARSSDPKAEALGFKDTVYHSTLSPEEFTQFDLSKGITGGSGRAFQDFLGVHVGTAKAASDRNIGASQTAGGYGANTPVADRVVDPQGYTMELRARTDNPLTKEKFAEMLGVPVKQFFKKTDGPFQEKDFDMVYEEYANELLLTRPDLARSYDADTIPRSLVAAYLRKDLADKGFTHIPYVNAVEDRGSTSFIMLTDRDGRSPAVLRDVRAGFDPSKVNDPDLRFNEGGPVASEENPYSILNLDPDAFVAALDELGLQGEERKFLTDQYFAQNRALPMTSRPEGKTVRNILPIATPEGMTGAEALMSGDFEFTAPEILRGLYEAPAEAINVASAIGKGVPVTEDQVQQAGQVVPEMITGIGPATFAARSLARGVEMPDPSVVSMSGVGPRGMGDNGGPAMQPQRYINPETGLYSPSYEAAKVLPQEVGTAQQMRAMLLKAGAKEEELTYSGFDDWLKGKEKVTKQEIEDVLGRAAAGYDYGGVDPMTGFETFPGPMPYARESYTSAGITGVQGADRDSLRRQVSQDLRAQASAERDARMRSELEGRGYRPVAFADESEFRQMADKLREATLTPGRLPPARVYNAFNRVKGLMERDGLSFNSPEVQRTLKSLADDADDYLVGPSGLPEHADEIISRELPEERTNPYFQSLPMETAGAIADRVDGMSDQELSDFLGIDAEEIFGNFDSGDTQYGAYVMPGLKNYSENLYKFDDAGRGVLSGIETLGVSRFNQPHFGGTQSPKAPIMFHTRTGQLETADGPAYHVAEMQSDIGQSYRKQPDRFFVPGKDTMPVLELTKAQKSSLQGYLDRAKEAVALNKEADDSVRKIYDDFWDDDLNGIRRDDPKFEEAASVVRDVRLRAQEMNEALNNFEFTNNDLFRKVREFYGKEEVIPYAMARSPAEFKPETFEKILSGTMAPSRAQVRGKEAALPFATSTNRWVDTALKNELIKAAKSNAEWFTLPRGEDVQKYTGGDPEGQAKFYEGIVPNRLKNLAKDFLPEGVEFRSLKAMGYGPKAPEYEVFGMRLTPEIKKAILEGGFPSFAKGGPVQGSSLDVDVFALR